MMCIGEKLRNEEVINHFKSILIKVTAKIEKNNGYQDILRLFIKSENVKNPGVSKEEINRLVSSVILQELNTLKSNEDYYIDNYITVILMRDDIESLLKIGDLSLIEIKEEISKIINFINEDIIFKERFFSEIDTISVDETTTYLDLLFSELNNINDILKLIFKYEYDINRELRIAIIKSIGVIICPYCNYHKLPTDEDRSATEADYEHMLPKGSMPLFSVSYGNFIPSCKNCNGPVCKGSKLNRIMNPRLEEFGDEVLFNISLDRDRFIENYYNNNDRLYRKDFETIEIDFENNSVDINKRERVENTIDLFRLKMKYNDENTKDLITGYINSLKSEGRPFYRDSVKDIMNRNIPLYVFKKLANNYEPKYLQDNDYTPDYINIECSKLKQDIADRYFSNLKES